MNRRKFIKGVLAGGTLIGLFGGGLWFKGDKNINALTVNMALDKLDKLIVNSNINYYGEWSPYQIFSHCAQSIEYSMQGFPIHKSLLFKQTLGQLGISLFKLKGSMNHNLNEEIPGAPIISDNPNTSEALKRLKKAFTDFEEYSGELKPHFAYGELSKQEYMFAHVMHLNNHLEEINL